MANPTFARPSGRRCPRRLSGRRLRGFCRSRLRARLVRRDLDRRHQCGHHGGERAEAAGGAPAGVLGGSHKQFLRSGPHRIAEFRSVFNSHIAGLHHGLWRPRVLSTALSAGADPSARELCEHALERGCDRGDGFGIEAFGSDEAADRHGHAPVIRKRMHQDLSRLDARNILASVGGPCPRCDAKSRKMVGHHGRRRGWRAQDLHQCQKTHRRGGQLT